MMLALCVLLPAFASVFVWRTRSSERARAGATAVTSAIVVLALALSRLGGAGLGIFELDAVSALLPKYVAHPVLYGKL